MAISIKNHEDRITALEKKDVNRDWVKLSSGLKLTTSPQQLFKIPTTHGLAIMWWNYTGGSVAGNRMCVIPLGHHYTWEIDCVNTNIEYIMCNLDNTTEVGYTICSVWHVNEASSDDNFVNAVWQLKLYYNFSYNITREFYKVKFKLKHYLCSHLQKFI